MINDKSIVRRELYKHVYDLLKSPKMWFFCIVDRSKSISVNSCSHCCFYLLSFPRVYRNMFFTQSLTKHNFTILDLRRTKLFGYGIDKTKRNVHNSELLFRILLYIFLSVNTATFRHVWNHKFIYFSDIQAYICLSITKINHKML